MFFKVTFLLCLILHLTASQCPNNVDPQENTLLEERNVCDWYVTETCCTGETLELMTRLVTNIKASNISELCQDYTILRECRTCSPSPLLDSCKKFCNKGKTRCTDEELCQLITIFHDSGYKMVDNSTDCENNHPFDRIPLPEDASVDEIEDVCTFQPVQNCFSGSGALAVSLGLFFGLFMM